MNTKITRENGRINVKTAYNKAFIDGVKRIGGKWNAGSAIWSVPEDNADLLDKLLISTVGCDIDGDVDKIRVAYDAADFVHGSVVKIGKFVTAERKYRDSWVRLHDDTAIISGEFAKSGGSAKYPHIDAEAGQVFLRSWIPAAVYAKLPAEEKALLTIVE